MSDLRQRLAAAITDDEARKAIWDAADASHPLPKISVILQGPSAGWLGIGRLMMKTTRWAISLHDSGDGTTSDNGARARIYTFGPGIQRTGWQWARRLDCAYVLAAMGPEAAG